MKHLDLKVPVEDSVHDELQKHGLIQPGAPLLTAIISQLLPILLKLLGGIQTGGAPPTTGS